jgi:hypothetical protein
MVIRFNQPHVVYERALYSTISQAISTKPSAMFDVVSVAPKARNKSDQPRLTQVADMNGGRVMNTLHEIGLPQSRINYTKAMDNVDFSEVRVFVH